MKKPRLPVCFIALFFALSLGTNKVLFAQVDTTSISIDELERRVAILSEELELMRSGEEVTELTADESRILGLAPSAATTYAKTLGPSFAGYGEVLYENYNGDKTTQLDYLRVIFYAGYRFSERFLFNSEIEVEHANEIFVEFAYIDWLVNNSLGVRAGMLLIPMGFVNELHEPNVFRGTERPVSERVIIPSTWRENGVGVYGSYGNLSYRLYAVNGFKGAGFSASGLRGGRQKGVKAKASSMAITGRLDYNPMPGIFVGASIYRGGADHNEITEGDRDVQVAVTIGEAHAQVQYRGLDLRGLYAFATVGEAGRLNRVLQLEGVNGIGERLIGGYGQAGYNVLSRSLTDVELTPYIRYELVDTQAEVPSGFQRKPSTKNTYVTAGIEVKPLPQVVLKIDHTWVSNDADTGVNQFNINVGYAF